MVRDTQPTSHPSPYFGLPAALPLPDGPEQDPLATWTLPPTNESPAEYLARQKAEVEAKKRSELIDEGIRLDKAVLRKERKALVKVLLVGQSESGKSTTLKNFRMRYARQAWKEERPNWIPVIQVNLIRAVHMIMDALLTEFRPKSPHLTRLHKSSRSLAYSEVGSSEGEVDNRTLRTLTSSSDHSGSSVTLRTPTPTHPVQVSEEHHELLARLAPLKRIEALLVHQLGAAALSEDEGDGDGDFDGVGTLTPASIARRRMARTGDVTVRGWVPKDERETEGASGEATRVLMSCCKDIEKLWCDDVVRKAVDRKGVKLGEAGVFFLDEVTRIAQAEYVPTDDDILRARLRTLGAQEYRLKFDGGILNAGMEMGREWAIYDIGGSRTRRAAWLPFFSSINALIFLAPISCFDERLAEDPATNRLEDSFLLWRSIAASRLLLRATLVVFLNKCDLLEQKMARGVEVRKFLPSYGDRRNEVGCFVKYLTGKFKDTAQQHVPDRILYIYATSAIDTKATGTTLKSVRDGILREHLKHSDLLT